MYTVDDRSIKEKLKDFFNRRKLKWQTRTEKLSKWCSDHSDGLLLLAIVSLPGLLKLGNTAIASRKESKVDRRRQCDIYDRRSDIHWTIKKPLNAREKLEFERRYANGESTGDILHSMHKL